MISVILATKDGDKYIDRAIESVFNQTEKDTELIVISDGSTDNTVQKINNWMAKDSRIKLIINEKNIGPGLARDKAIRTSAGEYIAIIDDDDIWLSKNKLALQREFLDKNSEYVLVGAAHTQLVDENGEKMKLYRLPLADKEIRTKILLRNMFIMSSVLFRKDAYLKAGGLKNMYLAEDYDLWLRMGLIGKFANLDTFEIAYTIRSGSASKKRKQELYKIVAHLVQEYGEFYPQAWLAKLKAKLRLTLFHLKNIA